MRRTSKSYKMNRLTYDRSRCIGSNCGVKTKCMRHTQIKKDEEDEALQASNRMLSYTDTLRFSDECDSFILEEK